MKRDIVFTDRVEGWVSVVCRRSGAILIAGLFVTTLCLGLASKIRLDTNMIALLPENTDSVVSLKRILSKTEGSGDLMVMIESPDMARSVDYARQLISRLGALPWVGRAEIGQDVSFYDGHKLLYMEIDDLREILARVEKRVAYEKLHRNPFYLSLNEDPAPSLDFNDIESKYEDKDRQVGREYYSSDDRKTLIVVIRPKGVTSDLPFARQIYNETTALISLQEPHAYHPEMRVTVGGTFKNRLDEYDTIVSDVRSGAVWVILGIVSLILLYFKHPAAVPIIVAPLIVSLAMTFALAYLAIGSLNLITVFLFIILFGLGIDFGIHLLVRYRRERGAGGDVSHSLAVTLRHTGRASLVSSLTTAAAFFVLMFAEFRGFSEFGFIAGFGLLFSSIAFLVVFPAIIVVTERFCSLKPTFPPKTMKKSGPLTLKHSRLVMGVCVLLSLVSLFFIKDLRFEHDLRQLRSDVQATREFNRKMRKVFVQPSDPSAVLAEGPLEAAAIATDIRKRIQTGGAAGPIQEVRTLQDLIPKDQKEKLGIISELRGLLNKHEDLILQQSQKRIAELRDNLNVKPVTIETLPDFLKQPFIGPPGNKGELVFIFQKRSLLDLRNAIEFSNAVGDIRANGKTYRAASEPLVYASMFQSIKREAPVALTLILLVVFSAVLLDVKSARHTIVVLTPLAVGTLWMLGAMAFFGIKLNLLNAVILPCVLGLGVDGGVHIYHRYREAVSTTSWDTLRQTGNAVAVCIATSMVGFGGMLSADHPGLRSIAVLALVGLGANMAASVIFFPALLAVLPTGARNNELHRSAL